MFLESNLKVESKSKKFHLRTDFWCLSVQFYVFYVGFYCPGKYEPGEYDFSGLNLMLHLTHHIVKFRRSCCKSFAEKRTFQLKAHNAVSAANWDSDFCLWCGVERSLAYIRKSN